MPNARIETDYLIVGAGAGGMAFADALIAESSYRALIVDRRHAPGGHWHDAYPFVRLHQPSAYYGVNSLPLGGDAVDTLGPNAGFYEVASASEICAHFASALQGMLATGRVQFRPLSDYERGRDGTHRIVSRLTGEVVEVVARRKLVDATYLENSVPATHRRKFEVAEGVRCVPINELARVDAPKPRYVVLGAGKTAMDACLFLLDQGTPPERIRWVKPREAYCVDRRYSQPLAQVDVFFEGFVRQVEAAAVAESLPDLFRRLEAAGQWIRVDERVEPTMYRCASISRRELELLRSLPDVVRLGHLQRVEPHRIVLQHGSVAAEPDDLYVDCTAVAFSARPLRPIFEPDRITLQPIRTCQPCFNSALVGHLEATRDDLAEKNRLCPPNPYPTEPKDWARMFVTSNFAQGLWAQDRELSAWIERSRLNASRGLRERRGEPAIREAMERFKRSVVPALQNLTRLVSA